MPIHGRITYWEARRIAVSASLTVGGKIMYNRYQMAVLSICLILATTGFIGAYSTPVANTIIVTFGQTPAETAAVDILQDEFPDAIDVEFGGLDYNLLKMRTYGPMIFVGHGSDQGIENGNKIVSVDQMECELKTCASPKIIILACDSEIIAAQDESGRTFGFSSVIDAELAALETAIRINIFQGDVDEAFAIFERYVDVAMLKISGSSNIIPLAFVMDPGDGGGTPGPYFSDAELWSAIKNFVIGCVFALIGFGISVGMDKLSASISSSVCYYTVGPTQTSKMKLVFNFIKDYGIPTIGTAVDNIYGGWGEMAQAWLGITVDAISDWTSSMSVGEWAIFIGITALQILIVILTAGSSAAVQLAVGIGFAAISAGTIAIADALDPDGTPCQTVLQAISSFID
ncbi:MAG: hypothetical protein ACTSUO_07305 [Candidatus Thorarchaeota archaeon]